MWVPISTGRRKGLQNRDSPSRNTERWPRNPGREVGKTGFTIKVVNKVKEVKKAKSI
jgi:hypothetical protein